MKSILTAILAIVCIGISTTPACAQTLGSCQIFPTNNPWNQRVDNLPIHWNSDKYIASVGTTIHVHPDFGSDPTYGIPWIAVNASQPFVPVDITGYIDESDPGPMPIPDGAPIESDDDSHVLIVDTSNHHLYELYQGVKDQNGEGWSATSTAIFALDSNNYRPDGWTSCDAAGLPIFPGLVRMDECEQGEINHALRFTVPHTQAGWIFPARHMASSNTDTTYMPMGLRLRLKSNFDDSKFSGYAKVISTALKRYGIILADNGSAWYISGETNTKWPDDDIHQLTTIQGSDFEAVYTGLVATHPNEYPIPPFDGVIVSSSANPYFEIVPNPASTQAIIQFGLEASDHVSLILYNALGCKVMDIIEGIRLQGENKTDFSVANLPNGVYFMRFVTATGSSMRTLNVVH